MSDITITLSLTAAEKRELMTKAFTPDLSFKVARAIERAESFVNDEPPVSDCRHFFECFGGYWEKCVGCDTVRENK